MNGIRLAAFALSALISVSCLGSNPPTEDIQTELARYKDLGRTAIDPLTPGVLTLTFDDGPSEFTKDVVDALERHKVPAVFFVVGSRIAGQRDVLEHARAHGQQVASHSYNHLPQPRLTEDQFKFRVRGVNTNIAGNDNGHLYFRFPFGAAGEDQLKWLAETTFNGKAYRPVGWHTDSQDFDYDGTYPGAEFSKNILDDDNVGPECDGQPNPFQRDMVGWTEFIVRKTKGGVLLFHDTKRITHDKIEEILQGFDSPEEYWAKLPADTRAAYEQFYRCEETDPFFHFRYASLGDGTYPSLKD